MKVRLGNVRATEDFELEFYAQTPRPDLGNYLRRHHNGDYGTVSESDKAQNDAVLLDWRLGEVVMSEYTLPSGQRFYIVSDGTDTTFQLPHE